MGTKGDQLACLWRQEEDTAVDKDSSSSVRNEEILTTEQLQIPEHEVYRGPPSGVDYVL